MTNIELEKLLIAAKKDIDDLKAEVEKLKSVSASNVAAELATLRTILDAAFRNAGLSNDWWQANAVHRNRPAAPVVIAESPKPQSLVEYSEKKVDEWRKKQAAAQPQGE